jgi:GNAT superfamily N-acetyltransferase
VRNFINIVESACHEERMDEIYPMRQSEMLESVTRQKINTIIRKGGLKLMKQVDDRTKIFQQDRGGGKFDLVVTQDRKGIGYAWINRSRFAGADGYVIDEIGLLDDAQGAGIGKAIYNALLDTGLALYSGGQQTPAGERMWRWLIGRSDLHVYVLDLRDDDKEIILPAKNGHLPFDPWKEFDSRLIVSKTPLAGFFD